MRNKIIDIMRGCGIIMMVAGHCGSPITSFVYVFHMSLFFMISGFCYKSSNSENYKSVFKYIYKKIKSIWFIYFFWTTVFILLTNVFINLNIYTNNPNAYGIPGLTIYNYFTWDNMLTLIIKAFVFLGGTNMGGAFWFLVVLFFISNLYCINDYLLKKVFKNSKSFIYFSQTFISILFLIIGFLFAKSNTCFYFMIEKTLSYYCLFYLGFLIKETKLYLKIKSNLIHFIILILSLTILIVFCYVGPGHVELSLNYYIDPIYLLISSLIGFIFTYEISYFISKFKFTNDIFVIIGQNTLSIVVFHFLIFKLVSFIEVLNYNLPYYMISSFPVLYSRPYWWLLYIILGISIPVILSITYKKIKNKVIFNLCKNNI